MNDEQRARVLRLVSDGRETMSGGGLTLNDAFGGVLEYLLDFGTSSLEVLAKRIADVPTIGMKERRVIAIWGDWITFARDIMNTLADKKLVKPTQDGWELAPGFIPGKSYEPITVSDINSARRTRDKYAMPITVTVFDLNTRAARDDDYRESVESKKERSRVLADLRKLRTKVEGAGLLTKRANDLFMELTADLGGEKVPLLPDEPDELKHCVFGDHDLPLTSAHWDQQLSRGQHYWRTSCRVHWDWHYYSQEHKDKLILVAETRAKLAAEGKDSGSRPISEATGIPGRSVRRILNKLDELGTPFPPR